MLVKTKRNQHTPLKLQTNKNSQNIKIASLNLYINDYLTHE